MIRFKLFGVQVCIHPSLWLTLGAVGAYMSMAGGGGFLGAALFVVAGFLCLFMHEMGHAVAGLMLGGGSPQVFLALLGGDCCNEKAVLTRTGGVLMTAAGPLASLLLGGLTMGGLMLMAGSASQGAELAGNLAIRGIPEESLSMCPPMAMLLAAYLMKVSVWWTALNLLPIFPLDGGQMMHGLMNSPRLMHSISLTVAALMTTFFIALGLWFMVVIMAMLALINYRCLQNGAE